MHFLLTKVTTGNISQVGSRSPNIHSFSVKMISRITKSKREGTDQAPQLSSKDKDGKEILEEQ